MNDIITLPRIAFILKGYPRLSETFIAQEIHALERRGLLLDLYSLRHPKDKAVHPIHRRIAASCRYLPEYLYQEPLRVLGAWRSVRRWRNYKKARVIWLADLRRDFTPNRFRRFGQALVLAAELPVDTAHLHAHFLHTPASVARYTSLLTGKSWSVSAHAKDIWTSPVWEKAEKLACCAWAVTCTANNAAHLRTLSPQGKVRLLYHGLDEQIYPLSGSYSSRDGHDAPVIILSVGRAVEKKGYEDLLEALALLPSPLQWRFVHVGEGPLLPWLKKRAEALGIASRIQWRGPQSQPRVLAIYRQADLFVLASKVADNGDRDGLPNVLMEAQSQGVVCISTAISAIPELILDGKTGTLVTPGDRKALSAAIGYFIERPRERERLGQAGQGRLRAEFSMNDEIDWLAEQFRTQGTITDTR